MVMNRYVCIVGLLVSCGLTGCITAVEKDFDSFQTTTMQTSELTQAKSASDLRQQKQKVVVFAYDEANSALTKEVNVKGAMASQLEAYLQKAGVEIVSRRETERQAVEEESKVYKFLTGQDAQYTGPTNADYVVMGMITSVDAGANYQAAVQGRNYSRPPQCQYNATMNGTLRVYSVAEGRVVRTINLRGIGSRSEDTTTSSCKVTSNTLPLVRAAAEQSLENERTQLQNLFSQKGFVVDKRTNKKNKTIFQVSLGKQDGLEPGSKIEIYTRFLMENQLTKDVRAEERKVADGKVTDFIGDDSAWIVINDEIEAERVKLGDHVKVLHKKTVMENLKQVIPIAK